MRLRPTWITTAALAALCATAACTSGSSDGDGDFVSDNPYGSGGGEDEGAGSSGGDGDGDGDGNGGEDDPGREIAEADIVQVVGDRIYALSRYSGLAVIDARDPGDLRTLGRFEAEAEPFEMYVDGTQAFVMFSGYGSWQIDEDTGEYSWQSDSHLMTLDVSDPRDIEITGDYAMPGRIQDSRRVGDVLYLVTYEDGYCWRCDQGQRTVVTSFDVQDETRPRQIDVLSFVDPPESYGWRRSVSATNERLYVAGLHWPNDGSGDPDGSRIEVVDISDPGGALVKGTSVDVDGQIESRWQMDEHEGVLRVVSQPGWWWSGQAPSIETFTVASSSQITPLGRTEMVLPRPESLRSVRFDGDRAYAITFERTDPLFTLDLSDPAEPLQVGELEIPGWVYHMEPRGDRILALGFDDGNPEGSINVSLFDVSDFANPAMLDRVHFGGDWANFAEDQDRVHKAFTILDDLGLVMVPYEGWSYDGGSECGYGSYRGGVQLVDFDADGLVLRGSADARGRARRAFLHRDHLFAVSDLAVQTFDISDRDTPQLRDEIALATQVNSALVAGDHIVRVARDWWSDNYVLEVANPQDPASPEPLGRLDLSGLIPQQGDCYEYYGYSATIAVKGYVYVLYESNGKIAISVVTLENPQAPALVRTETFDLELGYFEGWFGGVDHRGSRYALAGDALVLLTSGWAETSGPDREYGTFEVIDVSDPTRPRHAKSIDRGRGMVFGGLHLQGGELFSWHTEAANSSGSKVRFFLDRLRVDDPNQARLAASINVPGMPVAYRPDIDRALTVDLRLDATPMSADACWSRPGSWDYDYEAGICTRLEHEVYVVKLGSKGASIHETLEVERSDNESLRTVTATDERIFIGLTRGPTSADDWWGSEVEVVRLTGGKHAEQGRVAGERGWMTIAAAEGTRALAYTNNHMSVIDAEDVEAPNLSSVDTGSGYGCWSPMIDGDRVLCAKGSYGLAVVDLP